MAKVKATANFERNLDAIDALLREADAPQAFNTLLDDLLETVVPNLERFPDMGRSFLQRSIGSVETSNAVDQVRRQLSAIAESGDLREYVMAHYLLLYAHSEGVVYLLSIRHHRQLSFDLASHWPATSF